MRAAWRARRDDERTGLTPLRIRGKRRNCRARQVRKWLGGELFRVSNGSAAVIGRKRDWESLRSRFPMMSDVAIVDALINESVACTPAYYHGTGAWRRTAISPKCTAP